MSKPKVILTRKWPAEAEAKAQELFDVVLNEDDHKMSVESLKQRCKLPMRYVRLFLISN